MAEQAPDFGNEDKPGIDSTTSIEDGQTGSGLKAKVATDLLGVNRLFVSTELTSVAAGAQPTIPPNTQWIDMNDTTGGVARGTSIPQGTKQKLYSYTGSGLIFGWSVTLASLSSGWAVHMEIDGNSNFGPNGLLTDELKSVSLYNFNSSIPDFHMAITTDGDTFRFKGGLSTPQRYDSKIEIFAERVSNPAKDFDAGLIMIYKAT